MARGYKRLSFRARHLLRQLGKAKNVTLQRLNLHELRHAISRKHGFKGPKKAPNPGKAGLYQRLSGKARHLVRRLRHSRTWQVQKQSVTELEREVERGAQIAQAREARRQRREDRIDRAYERAKRVAERVQKAAKRTGRAAGAAGRKGWDRARPHVASAGRKFRGTVNRGQERLLTRAERKQRDRAKRGPGRIRRSVRSARDGARRRFRPNRQQPRRAPLRPRPARVQIGPPRPSRPPRPPRAARAPQPPARTR
jgi:hypothetical protein